MGIARVLKLGWTLGENPKARASNDAGIGGALGTDGVSHYRTGKYECHRYRRSGARQC
jgi:hypothetical protein